MRCETGRADAGFFMRATPVEQVREVAEAGESMPPKSTYFYPKVPTGLVFNPADVKIYTRKGDDGTTGLWYGGRVPKYAGRPEAYGSVDEAASALGLARAAAERGGELYADILRVQNELFVAGAELATAPEARRPPRGGRLEGDAPTWSSGSSRDIDRYMDRVDLPPKFVIPGGTELSARLDVARAAVRRAERRVAALKDAGDLADDDRRRPT